ncbi:MAG: sensor domain-containing diguanylate cyclase [candidate division KSB1 bacterium]|nr:sensor domain-containing diguanylate cyclase [candidate division KSB1 bacterium]MDZ7317597.1 sensor domain-containing diguanylate cyclase [candidate division KSB1 bacterium]MDZ7340306.1 sensor domain-containing diguanylate cyclase [candidate division KSB1 bacterium]
MTESFDSLQTQLFGLQKKYSEMEALNQSLNDRLLELYSLYQVSLTLSKTFDLDEILKLIKKLFQKTFHVDHFGLFLLDDLLATLHLKATFGRPDFAAMPTSFHFDEDIFGKALKLEEIIYLPDLQQNDAYQLYQGEPKAGAFVAIPLLLGKNRPLGVLTLHRRKVDSFSKNEIHLFKKISFEIAKVLDKTLLFQHTKELSITDDLTGLYNRRYFNQRFDREVQRAKRYNRPLTVMMVDIDYFKYYNDLNGHLLGDEVLKKVATVLESNLRKADIVARYGGEEFVILLPEIDKIHADQVAEKLRRTVEVKTFPKEQYQPNKNLTISLGLATLPTDSTNAKELLEFADQALYQAKAEGRNRVVSYHSSMTQIKKSNILHLEPKSAAASK